MNWTERTLGEVVAENRGLIQTGPFGSQLHQSDYSEHGIPVIMPTNIAEGNVRPERVSRVPQDIADKLCRHKVTPRTIVLPRRGEITKRAFIRENQDGWLCGSGCLKIETQDTEVVPEFLYYYMAQEKVVSWLIQHAVGTTMLNLSTAIVSRLPIRYPPRREQQRIAEVLSSYDDLIENNTRRMTLLGEAARLLYREWFVHLRFPGYMRTPVANGLPQGWARKPLEAVAEFHLGKMLDQEKNRGELMPYLANVNVRWGRFDLCDLREMRFEDDETSAYRLDFGDIVMCEGGEPGRCAIWKEQMPRMMIQKALHRIRCRDGMDPEYLYQNLRDQAESGHLAALYTGATIKHLPREKLAKVTVIVPPARLLAQFVEHARPIEKQLSLLEAASMRASKARDLLLPRLMSGEISV